MADCFSLIAWLGRTTKEENMEHKDTIKVGDTVNVFWEYVQCEFGMTVLSIPCATGDCWTLKRPKTNVEEEKIINVQMFCKMEKVEVVSP
jgi:hypothetical protein